MKEKLKALLPYLALVFLILGAKFGHIYCFGVNVPFWDQWSDEVPLIDDWYTNSRLTLATLFALNAEHRIVLTHLLQFILLTVNNQWDVVVQMVVNAFFHLACACLFFRFAQVMFKKLFQVIAFIGIVIVFSLPFSWENTLWGFQSQFYFLIFLSLISMYYVIAKPFSLRNQVIAWVFAILNLFTMGSGCMIAAPLIAICILRLFYKEDSLRNSLIIIGCSMVLLIIGVSMRGETDFAHGGAKSIAQFIDVYIRYFNWPLSNLDFIDPYTPYLNWDVLKPKVTLIISLGPVALFTVILLFVPAFRTRINYFLLAFNIWVATQNTVMAFCRAGLIEHNIFSRYLDVVALWLIASLFSFFSMIQFISNRVMDPARKRIMLIGLSSLLCSWAIAIAYGLFFSTALNYVHSMPKRSSLNTIAQQNVSGFMQTGDRHFLINKPHMNIPLYEQSDGPVLIEKLLKPSVQWYLGAEIRRHLAMASDTDGIYLKFNESEPLPGRLNNFTVGPYYTNYNKQENKEFLSKPIKVVVGLPYIKLWVTGNGALTVSIKSEKTGKVIDSASVCVHEKKWRALDLEQPKQPYRIEVRSTGDSTWFAVTAPRELGRLSYWIQILLSVYLAFLALGLILSIFWIYEECVNVKKIEDIYG